MAEEFKIKTKVDLDDSEARAKLIKLKNEGNDTPLKLKVKLEDLSKFENQMKQLKGLMNKAFKMDGKSLSNLKQLESTLKEINKLSKKTQNGILNTKESNSQKDLISQYRVISSTIDKLKSQMNNGLGDIGAEKTLKQIKDLENQLDKIKSSLSDTSKIDMIDFARANKGTVELNKNLSKIEGTVNQLDGKINSIDFKNIDLDRVQKLQNELKTLKSQLNGDLRLNIDVGAAQSRLKDIKQEINNLEKVESLASSFNKVESSIQRAFGQGTVDRFRSELSQLESTALSLDGSFTRAFKGLDNEIKDSINQVQRLGNETKKMDGFFGDFASSITAYSIGDIIGDTVVDSIRNFKDTILELDAAMTNMKKVADSADIATPNQLKNIKNEAIEVSKQVGMSTQDVVNGIASSLQAGMGSMEASIKVARGAMILANTGDMGAEEASKGLNTIINSFKVEPLKEMQVQVGNTIQKTTELGSALDMLNHASNNYAVTTKDLIDAFSNGGSVLSNYGVGISDATAMITAANLSLQDGNRVGNGLKSIAVNLASIKTSADSGEISLNKTALGLKEIAGIDVYSDKKNGQIKNMVQILDELQGKWSSLTQEQQNGLSEAIAGKQQATVFQSLMQNYDQFKKIRDEFSQGLQFGSAENENSEYIDSLAGRLNHLKAVWTSIATTVVNSDFIKGILDGFISLSEGIDVVIQAFDKVGIASASTFGLMGGLFSALKSSISSYRSVATTSAQMAVGLESTGSAASKLGGLLSGATGFLKNFIKQGLLIGGITFAVQALAKAWDYARNNLKNTEKELKAIENGQLTEINTNKEKINTLQTIGKEYEKLANKSSKSADEQSRMLQLGNELARVLPEIQIGTDSDGNAIISMTTDMQGYINKTNEAIAAQERLMLATNRERAENALKQKSKGELMDRFTGKGGLDKQALSEQEKYNKAWTDLEDRKIKTMNWLRESEGKDRLDAMNQIQDINNEQLKLEGEYGNRLAEINSQRMEGIDAFRDYANSLVTTGMDAIYNSTPEMKQAVQEFVNSLDFSEINTEEDLANVQRVISELPQMLDSGKLNIDSLRNDLGSINEEFSKTGNIEKYNSDMKKLAETISKETGWDVNTLTNMFTKMDNMFLQSKGSLEDYLNSFGSSMSKLKNGDEVAKALQSQYDSIQNYITQISNMPDSIEKQMELVVDLKNDETLPSQIRDMVSSLEEMGMSSDAILTVTAQAMIDWKDGGFDPNSLEFIRQGIEAQLTKDGMTFEQAVEVSTDIIMKLGTMDNKSVLKEIDNSIGEKEVTKDVRIETHGEEKAKEIEKAISILENRPDVNKRVQAVVNGEEDLIIFKDIIENMPVNSEYTNRFIVDNADALSKMNSWKEVQDWINKQPKEFKAKYGIEVDGGDSSKQEIKEVNNEIEKANGKTATAKVESEGAEEVKNDIDEINKGKKELEKPTNLSINKGELQGSVDEFNKLIEYSTKLKDGEYQISFKSDTADAIAQIENLKLAVNNLSNQFMQIPSTTITLNTSLAAKNLSGLIVRINQTKEALGTLSSKNVNINTAQSAKNLSGLITRVNQYKDAADNAKTATFNAETAQAAKNMSGLIAKINATNTAASSTKSINFKTNATSIANQVKSLASAIRGVPNGKTITYNIRTNGSVPKVNTPRSVFAMDGQGDVAGGISPVADTYSLSSSMPYDATPFDVTSNVGNGVFISPRSSSNGMLVSNNPIASPMLRKISSTDAKNMFDYDVDIFKKLENSLKKISNELDIISKKSENAFGQEKINYLQRQIELLKQQQQLQHSLAEDMRVQQDVLKNYLLGKGFTFDAENNIANYSQKLLAYEKHVKSLENKANANKDNDKLQAQYDGAKKDLDEIKNALNSYLDLTFSKIPDASKEWWELNNTIKDTEESIKDVQIALKYADEEINIGKYQNELDKLNKQLGLLDKQIDNLNGQNKITAINKKIELLKQEQQNAHNLANAYRDVQRQVQETLRNNGFNFDSNGDITNYEHLNSFIGTEKLEELKEIIEEYKNLSDDIIPGLSQEWWDMEESIKDCISEVEQLKISLKNIDASINVGKYEGTLNKVRREINRLDEDIERAFGARKEELIQKKIELIRQEQQELHKLANSYRDQAKTYKDYLSGVGFEFDSSGMITNLENIKNLTNDARYEVIKESLEEYIDLTQSKIPDLSEEWWDLEDSIDDAKESIEEARKELEEFLEEARVEALVDRFNDLSNSLDLIDKKLKHATGKDRLDLISEKLDIIKQQEVELQKHQEYYNNKKNSLQQELGQLGFNFDRTGNITNYVEQLEKLANSSDNFEDIKEKLQDYLDIQEDKLPDIISDLVDLENAYKDVLKEQLNTTKEIEDKITEMYKKQVEDRIDAMNKETDKKVESLKKQKEAYNKYREEANYKDEYEEKLANINDIQRQLDIAMRDTSLQGQKKVQELQKLLADAQKELDKFTQDKIDSDVNEAFDKEINNIEETNKNAIEALEKEWSESKIAEMVSQAISSGIFEGIDGKVSGLQDAMLEFAQETGELFGVMGTVIKSELISNLDIAMSTFKDLENIIKNLDLEKFSTLSSGFNVNMKAMPSMTSSASSIVLNAPMINIEGDVNKDVVEDLKSFSDKLVNDVINKISSSIR